jgi:hypothetical protein
VPVYDEPEDVRRLALASVVATRPSELIAAVDGGALAVARGAEYCDRVPADPEAAKRAVIAAGLRASDPETDVAVVLDSDTIWPPDAPLQRGPAPRDEAIERSGPGADRGARDDVPPGLDHAARSSRPFGRSAVRPWLLPDEPAPEILMAMQGDHAS